MRKIILIIAFILMPAIASAAGDIIVNNQPTYAVPPGSAKILVLDLTLPEKLSSIKISNLGTAQDSHISNLSIYQDGASAGWDGDELIRLTRSNSPFWGVEYTEFTSDFSKQRIFVAVDIVTGIYVGKTIQVQAVINSGATVVGLARTILLGASPPSVPIAPLVQSGQALSTSTIRWNFMDLSTNEFGFRIKDYSLSIKAENEQADSAYLDEKGLEPNTCYSGRRAFTFNDRGESFPSLIFNEVCTLAESVVLPRQGGAEEVGPQTEVKETRSPEETESLAPVAEADQSITIRQQIIDILKQIIQLLQEKLILLQANISQILQRLFRR